MPNRITKAQNIKIHSVDPKNIVNNPERMKNNLAEADKIFSAGLSKGSSRTPTDIPKAIPQLKAGEADPDLATRFGRSIDIPQSPGAILRGGLGAAEAVFQAPEALFEAVTSPIDTVKAIWGAQSVEGDKFAQAYNRGDIPDTVFRAITTAVPVLGPALSNIVEEALDTGDWAGATGKIVEMAGETALFARAPKTLKGKSKKDVSSAFEAADDIVTAKEVLEEGFLKDIPYKQRSTLKAIGDIDLDKIGRELDEFILAMPKDKTLDMRPAIKAVEEYVNKPLGGFKAGGETFRRTWIDSAAKEAYKEFGRQFKKFGRQMTPKEFVEVRRGLDKLIVATRRSSENTATHAKNFQLTLRRKMREIIKDEAPDLAAMDAIYAMNAKAQELAKTALEKIDARAAKRDRITPTRAAAAVGTTAGGATALLGLPVPPLAAGGAAVGTYIFTRLAKAIKSPSWKLRSAAMKNKIADHVITGRLGEIDALLQTMGEARQNQPNRFSAAIQENNEITPSFADQLRRAAEGLQASLREEGGIKPARSR